MEQIEIPVGDLVFEGLADGPDDGELVVLLHGFPQTSWSWRHQLAALAEAGYRAVAPDQRGYSPRARPDGVEHYRIAHLLADVLAIVDWLGGHQFHLVGHDWGAALAWQLAGRYPQRLRTLTALSVPHPMAFSQALRGEGGSDQAARSSYMEIFRTEGSEDLMLADGAQGLRDLYLRSGMPEADAERYLETLTQPGALRAALNWYRAMDVASVAGLGPITTPTLFIWSTDDTAIGREGAERTADHVEGPYRFEVFEGVSHWIAEEAPGGLNEVLLAHLGDWS
ncbi:MAG: alpha/beta fold hydrolase [Actinomycetota bacterium]